MKISGNSLCKFVAAISFWRKIRYARSCWQDPTLGSLKIQVWYLPIHRFHFYPNSTGTCGALSPRHPYCPRWSEQCQGILAAGNSTQVSKTQSIPLPQANQTATPFNDPINDAIEKQGFCGFYSEIIKSRKKHTKPKTIFPTWDDSPLFLCFNNFADPIELLEENHLARSGKFQQSTVSVFCQGVSFSFNQGLLLQILKWKRPTFWSSKWKARQDVTKTWLLGLGGWFPLRNAS